jgi:hypothetical protein
MEYVNHSTNPASSVPATGSKKYYFLDSKGRHELEEILRSYLSRSLSGNVWEALCAALPLDRGQPESLSRRVEGLLYASEALWGLAMESGKKAFGLSFDRYALCRSAGILPMSHYHYLRGSREPWGQVLTRRDALHDPQTAMMKLQRDIESLGDFILNLPKG